MISSKLGGVIGCGLVVAFAQTAHADWPVPRGDAQRTGTAEGVSDIEQPAVYWRSFEGGKSTVRGLLDVAEGDAAYAVISGGAIELHGKAPGPALWRTENLGARSLAGKTDLDRDGVFELVVATPSTALLLDGETGATLWQVPADLIGTIGTVRIADFTGDGLPELAVTECGCCGQRSGRTGFVWDFSASIASPRLVWEMPTIDCSADRSSVAFDSDGDGTQEWFAPRIGRFQLFEPAGAGLIAESDTITERLVSFRSDCRAAQLDADAAEEVVCLYNDPLVQGSEGHRIHAFEFNPVTSQLDHMWQFDVGEKSTAVLSRSAVADVDGDGAVEILANGELADGSAVAYVLNGEDGSTLAELPGVQLSGVVRDGRLVLGAVDGELVALSLQGGVPSKVWGVADRVVVSQWSRERGSVSGHLRRNPVVIGQGAAQQVLVRSGDGLVAELLSLPTSGAPASTSLQLGTDAALAHGIASDNDLLWTDTRGYAYVADGASAPSKQFFLGGYFASAAPRTHGQSPAVGMLRRNLGQEVFAVDSTGALRALQAANAGNVVPPSERFRLSNSHNPIVRSGLRQLACLTKRLPLASPQPYDLRLVNGNGREQWTHEIPARLQTDVMAGDLNGDGVDDYVTQWSDPANPELVTLAVNGRNGEALWRTRLPASSNQQPYGATLSDVDGDGLLDVLVQYGSTRFLSGLTGEQLNSSGTGGTYGTVTALQIDDDAGLEYVVHGGFYQRVILDNDLTLLDTLDDEVSRVFTSGVVVQCTEELAPRLFEPTANAPGAIDVFDLRGPSAGLLSRWVYAGGERFASEAEANQAGKVLAKLNSPSAHVNLTGSERVVAVFGSEDGWLYAVDACNGDVAWTMKFEAPVGAVAFGDTDDDGLDEVIVSVADGFLYAIKNQAFAAPATVVEAAAGSPTDVDTLPEGESLFVYWSEVSGADYYEVQLVDENGESTGYSRANSQPVRFRPRLLDLGMRYTASVRAVRGQDVSPDVGGDGVVVVAAPAARTTDGQADAPAVEGAAATVIAAPLVRATIGQTDTPAGGEATVIAESPDPAASSDDVSLSVSTAGINLIEAPLVLERLNDDGAFEPAPTGDESGDAVGTGAEAAGCAVSGKRDPGSGGLPLAGLGLAVWLTRRRRLR